MKENREQQVKRNKDLKVNNERSHKETTVYSHQNSDRKPNKSLKTHESMETPSLINENSTNVKIRNGNCQEKKQEDISNLQAAVEDTIDKGTNTADADELQKRET